MAWQKTDRQESSGNRRHGKSAQFILGGNCPRRDWPMPAGAASVRSSGQHSLALTIPWRSHAHWVRWKILFCPRILEGHLNHRLWRHRWRFSQYSSRPNFIVEICKNTYFYSYNFIPISLKSMILVFPHTLFQTQAPDFAKSQPLLRSLRFKPSFPVQISAAHPGEDI